MSRGSMGTASKARRPASTAPAKARGHGDRVARPGDGGVEKHRIKSEFHGGGGMGGNAQSRIHDQRHIGKMARMLRRP